MDNIPTVGLQFPHDAGSGAVSPMTNILNTGREVVNQQNPSAVPNSNIINQLNPNPTMKRPTLQKPVIERAPRSLFLFTVDNKFRKA